MIVQWCVKGLSLPDDASARAIIDEGGGLRCNWWRRVDPITAPGIRRKLTPDSLDRHVNRFTDPDPATGRPFNEESPYISLSAGTVERYAAKRSNVVHPARKTALYFGTRFGTQDTAYLFVCWVIVGPRPAVEVEAVAEEMRELNSYRAYSDFQLQGEITAKIIVPDNQIEGFERWRLDAASNKFVCDLVYVNQRFTPPGVLSNVRELV